MVDPKKQPDVKYRFSGHQTFTFRHGWLEKGVRGVAAQPDLFAREDALVTLGVGKNMVDSIRHWCQLAQLVEPDDRRERFNARFLRPTEIAKKLRGSWLARRDAASEVVRAALLILAGEVGE